MINLKQFSCIIIAAVYYTEDAKDFALWLQNVMHTPTFKTAAR
jgi:hypothetical protein